MKPVSAGIAAIQSRKHSPNDICSDAFIIRGVEPVNTIVSGPGPFLFVKLIKIYFLILQFMLVSSFVKSILIKWGGILESQFIGGKSIQSLVNI